MFTPATGSWTSKYFRTKASTAYARGSVCYSDGTDIIPAVAATVKILGIIDEDKAVGDATTSRIKVLVPRSPECEMLGDVGTGTLTAAYEGRTCDLKDHDEADITGVTYDSLVIKKFVSASKGLFSLNNN
jgi:hypothetical protein